MKLKDSLKDLSHHAYLLIGTEAIQADLISILEKTHHVKVHGNSDFIQRAYQNLTIDDARELKSLAEIKPITAEGKRIFIIATNAITIEAQNALLKILEEPASYVHFFLILPSAHLLLPTVKSRLSIVATDSRADESAATALTEAKKFLALSTPKRLEYIKSLVEDITKEKKTKQQAIDFLNDVQQVIYQSGDIKSVTKPLEAIETARRYINDRAPSVKMLLEYVALSI